MRKRFCGNILRMEMRKASSAELIYRSPLQKPMAKLLYQRSAGGSGHSSFVKSAGSIMRIRSRFDVSAEKNVPKNPAVPSEKLESKSEER